MVTKRYVIETKYRSINFSDRISVSYKAKPLIFQRNYFTEMKTHVTRPFKATKRPRRNENASNLKTHIKRRIHIRTLRKTGGPKTPSRTVRITYLGNAGKSNFPSNNTTYVCFDVFPADANFSHEFLRTPYVRRIITL